MHLFVYIIISDVLCVTSLRRSLPTSGALDMSPGRSHVRGALLTQPTIATLRFVADKPKVCEARRGEHEPRRRHAK